MITTPWKNSNGPIVDGQIFAIGDVHGHADTLECLLTHISSIQPRGKQRDVIFLGDLIDRGPRSLRCIDLALEASNICDNRIILPGNHELMMMRAMAFGRQNYNAFMHWFENGGHTLMHEIMPNPKAQPCDILEALPKHIPEAFLEMMHFGPTYHLAHRIMFIHAGLRPNADPQGHLKASRMMDPNRHHWAWIREDFLEHQGGWEDYDADLVVHGHTAGIDFPVQSPCDISDLTISHRRINVDVGASALPQIAAVEFVEDKYRLHIAEAPGWLGS